MQILAVSAPSPWRIRLVGDTTPSTTPGDYLVTRQDAGSCLATVTNVWSIGPTAVEMSLSEALLDDLVYVLTLPNAGGAPSATIGYRTAQTITTLPPEDNDPEADAFGVDIDWLADSLDANGDAPLVRGKACLTHDLAAAALTIPGELFHKPSEGAAMPLAVNGPGVPAQLSKVRASIQSQWARDRRVRKGGISVSVTQSTTGQVTANGTVQTVAVDDPLTVPVTTGSV